MSSHAKSSQWWCHAKCLMTFPSSWWTAIVFTLRCPNSLFTASVYRWLSVFVLPINSALNPIIYSISAPSFLTHVKSALLRSNLGMGNIFLPCMGEYIHYSGEIWEWEISSCYAWVSIYIAILICILVDWDNHPKVSWFNIHLRHIHCIVWRKWPQI